MINTQKNYLYSHRFIDYVAKFFGLLFILTAVVKLCNLDKFEAKLTAFPVLSSISAIVALLVPIFEITIAVLLFIRKTKHLGLHLACWWFILFTYFILLVIHTKSAVPYFYGHSWLSISFGPQLLFNNISIIFISIMLIRNRFTKKYTIMS